MEDLKTELFLKLPIELCEKIYNYIDFKVPGATALKEAQLIPVFQLKAPIGSITLIDSYDDWEPDLDDEWSAYQAEDAYWNGFYAAQDIPGLF
jgi:hypothetical protein